MYLKSLSFLTNSKSKFLIIVLLVLSVNSKATTNDSLAILINDTITQQFSIATDTASMNMLLKQIRKKRRRLGVFYKPLMEKYAEQSGELNYTFGRMKAYDFLGLQERYDENYDLAVIYHNKSLELAIQLKDSIQLCYIYNNLGQAYRKQDQHALAIPYFHKALFVQEKMEQEKSTSYTHNSLGALYLAQQDYDKATYHLQQSNIIAERTNDKRTRAFNYGMLGEIELIKNDPDKALQYFENSLEIKKQLNYPKGIAVSHHLIGEALFAKQEYEEAYNEFNKAIPIHAKYRNQRYLSRCYAYIGKIHLEKSNYDSVEYYLVKAKELAENVHSLENQILIQETFIVLFQEQEKWKKAFSAQTHLNHLQDSIKQSKYKKEIQAIEIGYQTKEKEQQIELLSAENKINNQRIVLFVALSVSLILMLAVGTLLYFRRKRENKQRQETLKQQLLRSQMNPHFLFNALGSIQNFMLQNETNKAAGYLSNFASLTRAILEHSAVETITVEDEIHTLKNYIELEKMRLQNSFDYFIEFDEYLETEIINIPPMLIQPFVENAIKHGLKNLDYKGILNINIQDKDSVLQVSVSDNGKGFKQDKSFNDNHKSMALDIFKQRIKGLEKKYKKKVNYSVSSNKDKGTTIVVEIPIID